MKELQRARQVIGMNKGRKRSAHPVGQRPACDRFKTRVQRGKHAVRRQGVDDVLRVLDRSEEHTSELQSQSNLVCRLLLEKKKRRVAGSAPRPGSGSRTP